MASRICQDFWSECLGGSWDHVSVNCLCVSDYSIGLEISYESCLSVEDVFCQLHVHDVALSSILMTSTELSDNWSFRL